MKKFLSVFIFIAFAGVAFSAVQVVTNIGHSTNIILGDTNLPAIRSYPHATGTLKAQATNESIFENPVLWGQFNYGTVMSGARSNESGWMWYSLDQTNLVKAGGGALILDPWRSWKYEPGNRLFNIPSGTWVSTNTNLDNWYFITVLGGKRSNLSGYFWTNLFKGAVAESNQVFAGAVRTAPVMPFVGPSLGKKFFIDGGTRFTVASNTSTWWLVSRADFTNGYISNVNFNYKVFSNRYTNMVTNQIPIVVITNPAGDTWLTNSVATFMGYASNDFGAKINMFFSTNGTVLTPISWSTNWTNVVSLTAIGNRTNIFYAIASNDSGVVRTNRQTNYIDLTPPALSIMAPASLATLTGTVVYFGTNTEDFSAITSLSWKTNDGPSTVTTGNNWSVSIDTTAHANGAFVFTIISSNSAGWVSTRDWTNYITN